jgi:hypothetical protein
VSYLSFGVGTTRHDVGMTAVDLPVKGAMGCPATASVPWRTPPNAGHYCLQVELLWDDDINPGNNIGQHNTDVKSLNSPHAEFDVPVRNDTAARARIVMRADGYQIPEPPPCPPERDRGERGQQLALHRRDHWPIPAGWRVDLNPSQAVLAPGEQILVTVDITAPDGFIGRQAINMQADINDQLLGGVTLYVHGTG